MGKLESFIDNRVAAKHINCTAYTWSAEPIADGQVAHIYVCNEGKYCNPFPGKAGTECRSNFENLRAVYLWINTYL